MKGDDAQLAVTDRSFVLPGTGQLVLDADFDDDEHTSFSDGLWGLQDTLLWWQVNRIGVSMVA